MHGNSLLYLVATPIGNLADLGGRARQVLSEAAVLAAEDTRVARKLFHALGIRPCRMVSVRSENEERASERLADAIIAAGPGVYISDAGTPGISDPGSALVRVMRRRGVHVEVVPGPSAALAAASVSGMCDTGFLFMGFLPRKGTGRRRALERISNSHEPAVIFEAPPRIKSTLASLSEILGEGARACLCRELTKMHEQVCCATLGELAIMAERDEIPMRGEFTLVVSPGPKREDGDPAVDDAVRLCELLNGHLPAGTSTAIASKYTGIARSRIYEAFIRSRPADSRG